MSEKTKVILGLVVFFIVLAFPIWYGVASGGEARIPELPLPDGECIQPDMRDGHMNLLIDWRDRVVRDGEINDEHGNRMSLTGTCLACHTDSEAFCNTCHDYADVHPTCWQCHTEQGGS